jgi:hypothetical protein
MLNYTGICKLSPAWYKVTVTDSLGCSLTDSIEIFEPPLLITDSSNISCYGYNDGIATVSASGGTPPYNYLWDDDDNSTTATITDLAGGRWYHVIVTDQSMQSVMDSVLLTEPDPIVIIKNCSNNICPDVNNGYIELNVSGGITPYTYNWSTGETAQDLSNLNAGKYKVTITDANGCIAEDSTQIDTIETYQDSEICMVTVNN